MCSADDPIAAVRPALRALHATLALLASLGCSRDRTAATMVPRADNAQCVPGRYLGLLYEAPGRTPAEATAALRRRFGQAPGIQVMEDPGGVLVLVRGQRPEDMDRLRDETRPAGLVLAVEDVVTLGTNCRVAWEHPVAPHDR